RLSVPSIYETPLSTADTDNWRGGPRPGASMLDAPVADHSGNPMFLTEAFVRKGTRFTLLTFGNGNAVEGPEESSTVRGRGENWVDRRGRPGRQALRCGCRRDLSAAAGWLRRCALPSTGSIGHRESAGARQRAQLRFLAMPLSTSSNFAKPDDAFRAIVEAHR